ncbi:MAG: glycosyltransferase family 4 protein, partial [Acidimicrobiales bacterium]
VHIVGDGETRPRLERQVRDQGLGDVFIFHGRVDQVERDRLIASAWLTVNPSAGEGWGLSVIEAAAHGVPAVAFHVPGLRDSVRDGSTGWLIDDGSEMAGTIEDALSTLADARDATRWARQCREWAGSFTWESTAERILAVLVSEHERLTKRLGERRRHTDATTVVELPRAAVNARIVQRLRRSDQIRMRDDGVELLLGGADEQDAQQALERVGVPPGLVGRTRVARHYDLLGWTTQRHFRLPAGGLDVTIDEEPEVDDHGTIELEEPSGQVIELRPRLLRELDRDEPTPGGPRPPQAHPDTAEEG